MELAGRRELGVTRHRKLDAHLDKRKEKWRRPTVFLKIAQARRMPHHDLQKLMWGIKIVKTLAINLLTLPNVNKMV
ncbi:hypothetical protein E2C01_038090 [Portunus trituberculatus]|uniref:Uncharacterized protein n=1 Tax=Portunus trituberculatus TaxID=210409 RepID=A0A5B7FFW1_PORTR|nr:hypothetical protein [Portunus trituberculatus]